MIESIIAILILAAGYYASIIVEQPTYIDRDKHEE
jgi:hypothetical protein